MKKLLSLVCAVLMVATMIVPAFAVEIIGQVLSTDIRAYINGAEIPAYNIDGRLAIVVSDLNNYGFTTIYNNNTRRSSVTRNYYASGNFVSVPSKASGLPIGARVMDVYKSDITVDLDGRVVPACNVDNRMAIYFSDLQGYGSYTYDNSTRTSKIVLSGSGSTGTGSGSGAGIINYVENFKLVKSPADYQLRSESEKVSFTVQISGGTAPYTYKWFIEKDTETSTQSATLQNTSSTFNVPFTASSFNNTKTIRIYAEVTDSTGAKVTSAKATVKPVAESYEAMKITKQPVAYQMKSANDTNATFTVEISGGKAPYTYKWIEEVDGYTGWAYTKSASDKKNTFTVDDGPALFRSYRTVKLYCEITDANNSKVTSNKVELKPYAETLRITKQPQDITVSNSTTTGSFTVTVSGGTAPYTYDWHIEEGRYHTAFASYSTTKTSDTLTLDAYDLNRWAQSTSTIYAVCEITDASGKTVTSEKAKINYKLAAALQIVSQTRDTVMKDRNETLPFTVTVSGGTAPYSYDWYFIDTRNRPTYFLSNTSSKTSDTINLDRIDLRDFIDTYEYIWIICEVTDANRQEVSSRQIKLTFPTASSQLSIKTQPKAARADAEGWANFSVEVTGGKAPYTYDWYVDVSGYVELAATETTRNTFTVMDILTDYYPVYTSNVQVYCVITDAIGQSVTTKRVQIQ